ncbi:MAG TPA: SGNH/GDSL hydrolase family protein [Kineosporiaceae bacterium]|nr:SGNH/GDSL hydrolase family protein [Kineosporiaceae bacterium]
MSRASNRPERRARWAAIFAMAGVLGLAAITPTATMAAASAGVVTPTDQPSSSGWPAAGVLRTVHTAGRVEVADDRVLYSWPGVYFESRFRGTGIGVKLDDPSNDYDVQVDGTTVSTLVTPEPGTHWITGLAPGAHRVRLVKRTESPWATSQFAGFVPAVNGAMLARPSARSRQIEFIGDSYTAGYGNLSSTRDCTSEDVNRTTNADRSFGALTAKDLNADFQINGYSGRGMVRNYNGQDAGVDYRTFYDRALLAVEGDRWPVDRSWRPQLVVVGLGINDFSTAVNPVEVWTSDTLLAAYRTAYHAFIDKLRARYGPRAVILVSATALSNTTQFADAARQIVQERHDQGDDRVRYWYYDTAGMDYGGCHWHPSVADHRLIADRLEAVIATLPLRW